MEPKEYAEKFSSTVNNGFVALEIALGHKLGLFKALLELKESVTSTDLAKKCKLKERYVREWLGSMSAAKFVSITADDKYFIPEDCKPLTGESFFVTLLPLLSDNMSAVIDCFKEDGPKGYNYCDQFDKLLWLGEGKASCDGQWIDDNIYPTGHKNKDSIHCILDIGCGTGHLTVQIAKYFPTATVYGIDIDEKAIQKAKEIKEEQNISNVEFYSCGAESMDTAWENKFDWILLVDVLHDMPNPQSCITEVKRVLKDDGIGTAVDPLFHSDHKMNVGDPRAAMMYVISTFVCLPCSMSAEPASGLGIGWGLENKLEFLKSNGFQTFVEDERALIHFTKG